MTTTLKSPRGGNMRTLLGRVLNQRDPCGAVGVVFYALHRRRHPRHFALEVYLAVQPLVPAAAVPARHAPKVVTPACSRNV